MRSFKVNLFIAFLAFSASYASTSQALELTLSIQPILPKKEIIKAYQPLADYLSSKTGHNIKIKAHSNFLAYWSDLRRSKGFDLVLDAAHFTDYRILKKKYIVLAKIPDTVSFSVVTHEDNLIFDIEELALKKMATMVSPSVGGIRIQNYFTNPMSQPKIIYAKNSNDAAQMVIDKKVIASIIPTALVSRYEGLNTITTTTSLPHMAFSASPKVPADARNKIKQALIRAKDTAEGQAMLAKINFPSFEPTNAKTYKGFASLLETTLGY